MSEVRDQMQQARELIEQGRFTEARALLQTINHPKAQEWIARIDQEAGDLDFPTTQSGQKSKKSRKESRGPGCLKIGLGVGCIAPIVFCIGVVIIIAIIVTLVQQGEKAATEEAIERNGGFGSFEKPIAAQEWADFETVDLRAMRIERPADAMVEEFNPFNDDSPEGADYVLVWFELRCEQDKCSTPISLDLQLMEDEDTKWGESLFTVVDNDLDADEALDGSMISGWQLFEFPTGKEIKTIRAKWGSETLHLTVPPSGEQS